MTPSDHSNYRASFYILLGLLLSVSSCDSLMMPIPPYRGIAQLLAIGPWGLWFDSISHKLSKRRGLIERARPEFASHYNASKVLYLDLATNNGNSRETPPETAVLSIDDLPPVQPKGVDSSNISSSLAATRIVVLSDTHGKHRFLNIPNGDILCHCGDVLLRYGFWGDYGRGKDGFQDFLQWMVLEQPHPSKIFIGGNHDTYIDDFQPSVQEEVQKILMESTIKSETAIDESTIVYLENNHTVVSGWKIWGSPYSLPTGTSNRAFQFNDKIAEEAFDAIDNDVDIVLTHSGVLESHIMDKITATSKELSRIPPALWLYGHFHDGYGMPEVVGDTIKINCATTDMKYRTRNLPVVIDMPMNFKQNRHSK